jgi:Lon protease-like protein
VSTERTTRLVIIPLENIVFFPETFLDLKVADRRAEELLRQAYENQENVGLFLAKLEVLTQLPTGFEKIGTFGRVVAFDPKPGKPTEVTLQGRFRGRIRQIIQLEPYPTADITVLTDHLHVSSTDEFKHILEDLIDLVQLFKPEEDRRGIELPSPEGWRKLFGMLVNSVASFLPSKPHKKQEWLVQDDLVARYRMVREELVKMWQFNRLMDIIPPPPEDAHLN